MSMNIKFNPEEGKLNVVLHTTTLPQANGDYYGRVEHAETIDMTTIIAIIANIAERGQGVSALNLQYCSQLLKAEALRLLAAGKTVNLLDLCRMHVGVKGSPPARIPSPTPLTS